MNEDEKDGGRFKGIARRILGDPDDDKDIKGEARELFNTLLSTGDKAKTELLKVMAREFRQYLTEMGIDRDIRQLLSNYSLDINASLSLRRKEGVPDDAEPSTPNASNSDDS